MTSYVVYASKRALTHGNECKSGCECMVELRKFVGGNSYELSVVSTFSNPAHLLCVNIELADDLTILGEETDNLVIDGKKATACRVRFFVEPVIQQVRDEEEEKEEHEPEDEAEEKDEENTEAEEQEQYASWFRLDLVKDV